MFAASLECNLQTNDQNHYVVGQGHFHLPSKEVLYTQILFLLISNGLTPHLAAMM